tara:strand:- start:348 stop:950 length:603 start_codon:yes stop_codon:yes gene_type:complete
VVHLRPRSSLDLTRCDGFVVTGGHDVEPVLYKALAEVRGRYDPERDAFESAVIGNALERRKPLLAICRGLQLLNVVLGGSLTQDLTQLRKKTSNRRTLLPLKTLEVVPDTVLDQCLARPRIKINSLHGQGIARLGDGLRVGGRDLDGILQAVEHVDHRFVVGVQWHPEFLVYQSRQRCLFASLVRAAEAERDELERGGVA